MSKLGNPVNLLTLSGLNWYFIFGKSTLNVVAAAADDDAGAVGSTAMAAAADDDDAGADDDDVGADAIWTSSSSSFNKWPASSFRIIKRLTTSLNLDKSISPFPNLFY